MATILPVQIPADDQSTGVGLFLYAAPGACAVFAGSDQGNAQILKYWWVSHKRMIILKKNMHLSQKRTRCLHLHNFVYYYPILQQQITS